MAAEDRLLLLLGADRAQTPEEWAEATRKAADAYSEWMTIRE
jgi:phosphodiesterase/alkaline phosphatase D-like protein